MDGKQQTKVYTAMFFLEEIAPEDNFLETSVYVASYQGFQMQFKSRKHCFEAAIV